jgi:hypothetical protein
MDGWMDGWMDGLADSSVLEPEDSTMLKKLQLLKYILSHLVSISFLVIIVMMVISFNTLLGLEIAVIQHTCFHRFRLPRCV